MSIFKKLISESSLSRLWAKTQSHSCGCITGFRKENPLPLNRKNNSEIQGYLMSKGYSLTSVAGSYIENFQTPDAIEVSEPTYFVCNHKVDGNDGGQLRNDLIMLGQKYDQDSVLIIPVGGVGAYLYGTSKRSNAYPLWGVTAPAGESGTGTYGKVAGKFLSRIRGRQFAFEELEPPTSRGGMWALDSVAKKIERELIENTLCYEVKDYNNNMLFERQSLSNVWRHSSKGFFIISAFRDRNDKINMQKHGELKRDLQARKLGYYEVDGAYTYDNGMTSKELSVFVPFRPDVYSSVEFKRIAHELCVKYQQESVLLYTPDLGLLINEKGYFKKIGDQINYDKIVKNFSILRKGSHKGRRFSVGDREGRDYTNDPMSDHPDPDLVRPVDYIFEGVRVPSNHLSAMLMEQEGCIVLPPMKIHG
jgi:hypothetical protein